MEGGNGSDSDSDSEEEDMEIDVAGEALSGAKSIFARRLKSRDPNLFLKKDTPGYHSYSRSCPGQYRRQPMILTDAEKKWIDEKDEESNSKSYDESVRYGSEKDGPKYNYICPRFWCIRDNTGKPRSLSVKQVNDGECGGWDALVPEGAKKVPKGKRIVEFTDERFHRENSKIPKDHPARKIVYRPMYPGFQDKTKHPDQLCIPCCYQSPFGDGDVEEGAPIPNTYKKPAGAVWPKLKPGKQIKKDNPVRELYESKEYMKEDGKTINFEKLKKIDEKFRQLKYSATDLPVGCDQKEGREEESKILKENISDTPIMTFPLKENQTGYMNLSLQRFLGFNNSKICYTKQSADEKKLKLQSYCIVRLGIDKNKNQSFLHLLANVYNFYEKRVIHIPPNSGKSNPKILNIKDFKSIFIGNLTIDTFVTAQNGILPQLFDNENIEIDNLDNYRESKYLKKITNIDFIKKIVRAFENFRNYILDDDEKIDYRYIWDLVCKSESEGGILFKDGINLLIFKNPNDDITSKIEIICPTNHYSEEYFNKKKPDINGLL